MAEAPELISALALAILDRHQAWAEGLAVSSVADPLKDAAESGATDVDRLVDIIDFLVAELVGVDRDNAEVGVLVSALAWRWITHVRCPKSDTGLAAVSRAARALNARLNELPAPGQMGVDL
ncbi:hypothetical protein [Nocardia nepalensis]|uniref:hypothetical protein n=1 Tax=Nocardia nepalensis TaxID=3375448 RepID=UPI003B67EE79